MESLGLAANSAAGNRVKSRSRDAAATAERSQLRSDYVQRGFRVIRREAGTYTTAESEKHVANVEKELA